MEMLLAIAFAVMIEKRSRLSEQNVATRFSAHKALDMKRLSECRDGFRRDGPIAHCALQ
jgi:hypothetical protein